MYSHKPSSNITCYNFVFNLVTSGDLLLYSGLFIENPFKVKGKQITGICGSESCNLIGATLLRTINLLDVPWSNWSENFVQHPS